MTLPQLETEVKLATIEILSKRWERFKNRKLVVFRYARLKLFLRRINVIKSM